MNKTRARRGYHPPLTRARCTHAQIVCRSAISRHSTTSLNQEHALRRVQMCSGMIDIPACRRQDRIGCRKRALHSGLHWFAYTSELQPSKHRHELSLMTGGFGTCNPQMGIACISCYEFPLRAHMTSRGFQLPINTGHSVVTISHSLPRE